MNLKNKFSFRNFASTTVLASALLASKSEAQIAKWTFETSAPVVTPGAGIWVTNVAAEIGTGIASGFHAGNAAYTSPAGNGSSHSFSANTWAVGDIFQFAT